MNILLTGIPSCGKTTIARELKDILKSNFKIINDKKYSIKHKLGYYENKEYVVPISNLNKSINAFLKENKTKSFIFEGHLFCELAKYNLNKFDYIFVLETPNNLLKKRLIERKYDILKIEDNLYCNDTNYIQNKLNSKKISFKIINVNNNIKLNTKKINNLIK